VCTLLMMVVLRCRVTYTPVLGEVKYLVKPFGSTVKKALRKAVKQGTPVMWQEKSRPPPRDRDVRTCVWVAHIC
jgi:hypothetical protein